MGHDGAEDVEDNVSPAEEQSKRAGHRVKMYFGDNHIEQNRALRFREKVSLIPNSGSSGWYIHLNDLPTGPSRKHRGGMKVRWWICCYRTYVKMYQIRALVEMAIGFANEVCVRLTCHLL